jgi:hypothetical protein
VPAPDIENLVVKTLRERFAATDDGEQPRPADNRDLIECRLDHVVIKAQAIEIHLAVPSECAEGISTDETRNRETGDLPPTTIKVPWSLATFAEVKGVLHSPSPRPTMKLETRDALLGAIAKARTWINHLVEGRVGSFGEIATREGKVERYIRLLAPLAFVSPRIISGIMDGTAPPGLTVTGLAQPLAYSWTEQERQFRHERANTDTSR